MKVYLIDCQESGINFDGTLLISGPTCGPFHRNAIDKIINVTIPTISSLTTIRFAVVSERSIDVIVWQAIEPKIVNKMGKYKDFTYGCISSGIFHPLIWERRKSVTETSNGNSGIHTINFASPEYVPYLTIMDAFDDPLASDPSTYTELHDEDTCNQFCIKFQYKSNGSNHKNLDNTFVFCMARTLQCNISYFSSLRYNENFQSLRNLTAC